MLHLNDGQLPGHTVTSPEGDSINCDSINTDYRVIKIECERKKRLGQACSEGQLC